MNKTTKIVGAALGGTAGGVALAFLICAATAIIAIFTDNSVVLLGVFSAIPGTENGAISLEFTPNMIGIAVVVALCGVGSGVLAARTPVRSLRLSGEKDESSGRKIWRRK
ncbi:hypothetical protein [Paenarthrobacter sp.]|uniref:hypothetical protein n=1 Tax=Paenarthrobacter sp. TaxID=1931993 RepID=UPI0028128DA5|nr:hypothetical protein [Paenarthrobacter sp.]